MEQAAHLKDIMLVSQNGNFHCINEITLNYHSTNLLLYFTDSGTELFLNSPKFWLKLHARTPMFKLGSSTQTVARDDVSLRIKLKI